MMRRARYGGEFGTRTMRVGWMCAGSTSSFVERVGGTRGATGTGLGLPHLWGEMVKFGNGQMVKWSNGKAER